jgi:hypothetical protein
MTEKEVLGCWNRCTEEKAERSPHANLLAIKLGDTIIGLVLRLPSGQGV